MSKAEPKYETRTVQIGVVAIGQPLFDESVAMIEIADEAAGEFIAVTQPGFPGKGIQVNPDEWPVIREAIDRMVSECRDVQ